MRIVVGCPLIIVSVVVRVLGDGDGVIGIVGAVVTSPRGSRRW